MKKKTALKIIYVIYLILLISFIFFNSALNREASSEQSGRVLRFINSFFESVGIPIRVSSLFVRKTAHFIEYFVLGASFKYFFALFRNISIKNAVYSSYCSTLVAMADETIQYFSGRGSMLLDVWLDSFAAFISVIIFYLILKHKKSKAKEAL